MQDLEYNYFECQCYSPEHRYVFIYDPDENEIYVEPHLSTYKNVFKRIWVAIKYIFGYKSKYGNWDCWMLKNEDVQRLINVLSKVKVDK